MKKTLLLFPLIALTHTAFGQVLYTTGTVSQNFNTMNSNTSQGASATPDGWFVRVGDANSFGTTVTTTPGGANSSGGYNWGAQNNTDRVLGGISATTAATTVAIDFRLTNNSVDSFTGFSLEYTGVQWRQNTTTQTLQFSYSLDGISFTPVSSYNFTSPQTGASGQIDGYNASNRQTFAMATNNFQSGTTWDTGETLYLRWYLPTTATATGIALGVDNVSFAAVPEPAAAALAVMGIGTVLIFRRRHQRL